MTSVDQSTARLYRQFRQHQRDVQVAGGGAVDTYPGGRVELSYAGAPYGRHAAAAFAQAKHQARWLARHRQAA